MNGACAKCNQRDHLRCAQTRACACRALGHPTTQPNRRQHDAQAYADVSDAFRINDVDAHAALDDEGDLNGFAYRWHARARHYHYVSERVASGTLALMKDPVGRAHASNASTRTPNTSQPERAVRVTRDAADAFVARYEAQRTFTRTWASVSGNGRDRAILADGLRRVLARPDRAVA